MEHFANTLKVKYWQMYGHVSVCWQIQISAKCRVDKFTFATIEVYTLIVVENTSMYIS